MSAAAAERPDGQAAADNLAEGREVGRDVLALPNTAGSHPKSGHHLIKDQNAAVALGCLAQCRQKSGQRQHEPHVADVRLDDHGRNFLAMLFKRRP